MEAQDQKYILLDSVIGWNTKTRLNLNDVKTNRVAKGSFRDKNLVQRLINENIIKIDEENQDLVYFVKYINSEGELRGLLEQKEISSQDLILDIWRRSIIGLSLQRVPGERRSLIDERGTFGGYEYPTGLAIDKEGRIYISDTENHAIKVYDPCKGEFSRLSCVGEEGYLPRQLRNPRGLAISETNDIYIADTGNHRVQVFSLKGGVLRKIWGKADASGKPTRGADDGQFNEPTDIAIDSSGDVYVADKGNSRIQKFSKRGKFLSKLDGTEGNGEGLIKPTHIAIDKEDILYVIDEEKDSILKFDTKWKKIDIPDDLGGRFNPTCLAVDNEGNAYVAEASRDRIFKFCGAGGNDNKTCIVEGSELGGLCSYLVVDDGGVLYAALEGYGLVAFEPEVSYYENERDFISELDSKIYKCKWHRILIDADIPEGTTIAVQTFTSESKRGIAEIEELISSKDFSEIESRPTSRWSSPQANEKDFLILSPPGRYLWLKVTLKGNTTRTPILKGFRVYYPRVSYLKDLPKVYQEDETSSFFLERFLSIFETMFSGLEDEITNISQYFNPYNTPKKFLHWLASWLALVLDEKWPEEKKRELIRLAPELYKKRGTLEGLKDYIAIYTGLKSHINVIEHYKLRRWTFLGETRLGGNSVLWGKGIVGRLQLDEYSKICNFRLVSTKDPLRDPFHVFAHRFTVFIPSAFCEGVSREKVLKNIIDVEKPAHTQYSICKVESKFRVGVQSTIGVDTIIGVYPVTHLGLEHLGTDSVLGEYPGDKGPPSLRVGKSSRIGAGTVIN